VNAGWLQPVEGVAELGDPDVGDGHGAVVRAVDLVGAAPGHGRNWVSVGRAYAEHRVRWWSRPDPCRSSYDAVVCWRPASYVGPWSAAPLRPISTGWIRMLVALSVKNFKSIREARVRFGALTCIIGHNGVGKSNLFDAIHFLSLLADNDIFQATVDVCSDGSRG
jgi:hypothetical protein